MNLLTLFQSVADLVFEVAIWVIVIPRTFVRVLFRPRWAQEYVLKEFSKDEAGRFDESLSPIIFWLIVAVLPYLWMFSLANTPASWDRLFLLRMFKGLQLEGRMVALTLFLIFGPLGFSTIIQLFHKGGFGKQTLRRVFHTQCLCMAPPYLFFLPAAVILSYQSSPSSQWDTSTRLVFVLSFLGSLGWAVFAEIVIVAKELEVRKGKAFLIFLVGFVASYALMIILGLIVFAGTELTRSIPIR